MDKGATLISFEDRKAAKASNETHILSENLRRSLLERRAELIANELDEILIKLTEEE